MKTIHIIGDSTVETNTPPFYGWGGQLAPFVPECHVLNAAKSGRSSKSFWDEGLFLPVKSVLKPEDLLLICFGHNDEKDDPQRHTDPAGTFPQMLLRYVNAAREAQAVPVLLTSAERCYFLGDGSLLYTHGEYPFAVRTLCAREQIALIDLNAFTRTLYRSLGAGRAPDLFVHCAPGEYDAYPNGYRDQTHFSLEGARALAQEIGAKLRQFRLI